MTHPLRDSLSNLPLSYCILQGKCAVKTHVLAILLALAGLTSTASAVDPFFMNLGTVSGGNDFSVGQGNAEVSAISFDGSVVVGTSENASFNEEAFVWTQTGGMVGLGSVDWNTVIISSISADGSVAVGEAENAEGNEVAFLWDNVNGTRDLKEVLIADGILESILAEWNYLAGIDVSSDGLTIVGNGEFGDQDGLYDSRAWIARIDPAVVPEPSSLISCWASHWPACLATQGDACDHRCGYGDGTHRVYN